MKNQLKFSTTNVTIDTCHTRLHDCPHCRCLSPNSRPQSPIYYRPSSPISPVRNNIYFKRSNVNSNSPESSRSLSRGRSDRSRSPYSRIPRVTIRYISPNSSRQGIPRAPKPVGSFGDKDPLSSAFSFGKPEEPRKPGILGRQRKITNKKIQKKNGDQRYHVISQYKCLEEDRDMARTFIKELQLNYDYFQAQDISDISADVSL